MRSSSSAYLTRSGATRCARSLVTEEADLDRESVRDGLRDALPAHALPQRVRVVRAIPQRGPGKPDRRAVAAWFTVGE